MSKNVLFMASNYGLWAEELQAPWDAVRGAGHYVTLATYLGRTPLPITASMDPDFFDPQQKYYMNPPEVVDRVNQILDSGEWDNPTKIADVTAADFDAVVVVGGPGAPLDLTGNLKVHNLLVDGYKSGKCIAAMCYGVAALAFSRDTDDGYKSIAYGRTVTAHPHAWDFAFDLRYSLVRSTTSNPGTDIVTPGFVFPLQYMMEDAVGPEGRVIADTTANRQNPCVCCDGSFITALSVESAILFGEKIVEKLK
jgi:putative intracellular protease/amidase